MIFTDTHTHLYLQEFDNDRDEVINKAISKGVKYMLLPNIDDTTINDLLSLVKKYPGNCFPMIGLHPTSVKNDYKNKLTVIEQYFEKEKFYAVGETGIDLYWDKSHRKPQEKAFRYQIEMALKYDLPVVIHQRNSYDEILKILQDMNTPELKGVFHCFTGTPAQADEIINIGFLLGIGGVLTFKNSRLSETIKEVNLKNIVLETDSPFLAPHPYRGKRNESAYTYLVAKKLADVKDKSLEEIAEITTGNAKNLFNLPI